MCVTATKNVKINLLWNVHKKPLARYHIIEANVLHIQVSYHRGKCSPYTGITVSYHRGKCSPYTGILYEKEKGVSITLSPGILSNTCAEITREPQSHILCTMC